MAPRVRPFNVGVMLDGNSLMRPLLGVTASKDGGIIIWPKTNPGQTWRYGTLDVPSGKFAGITWTAPGAADLTSQKPPKIHYHRSGSVSANLTGVAERRSFKGLPMRLLNGGQFFTATFESPERMPTYRAKKDDVFVVVHDDWPVAVHVQGFLFNRTRLRPDLVAQLNEDRAVSLVQNDRDEIVVDLAGHGADTLMVLRLHADDGPAHPDAPTRCAIAAFDTKMVDLDATVPAVAVWNPGPWPNVFGLTPKHDRPFAHWGTPTAPLVRRTRPNTGAG